jgi:hypothetical protein
MSQSHLPPQDIPDLSSLSAQTVWAATGRFFFGGGSTDAVTQTLLVNGVRLLDASVRDYSLGRDAILAFHASTLNELRIGRVAQATTHFESCIWHLERFIKHARAIRARRATESELKALIPSNASFLNQSAEHQITSLRHVLAHLERAALNGELPQGQSVALLPVEDGLSISTHTINWQDLAQWLRDAHACVERLARYRPSSP